MAPSMRLEGAAANRTQRRRRHGVITSGRAGRGAASPRGAAVFAACLGAILMPFFTLALRATPGGGPDCTAVLVSLSGGEGGTGMSSGGPSSPSANFAASGDLHTNLAQIASKSTRPI